MTISDREPQYLGTHRGISRIQLGWTTLYFHGDSYTHAIGNLYGTYEQPAREDIAAARKAIPVRPRPPVMAHSPSGEHKDSRHKPKAPAPDTKPRPHTKAHSSTKTSSARSAVKPTPSSGKPRAGRKPSAKRHAPGPAAKATKSVKKPAKTPISTMAGLMKSVTGATPDTKAKPIGSMNELAAQLR